MRLLAIALLVSAAVVAEERPLRFSVSESWVMPMMNIENGQATGGILYDLQTRLAEKVGRRAEQLLMPRLRVQQMLARGEIDVRCYVNPAWLTESHHQYIWSVPFLVQRDWLVGRHAVPLQLEQLHGETIGTVLQARTARMTSNPLRSGRPRSSRMTSGVSVATRSMPAPPDVAVLTFHPWVRSVMAIARSRPGSSSTTRT